jgi:catechol 2,3-dioxygenase-like lactoylglutathione lyase family enzyme
LVGALLPLHHVDVHTTDLDAARRIFDGLMPEFGLSEITRHEDCYTYHPPGVRKPFLCLMAGDGPVAAGTMRVAFAARSREHVDKLARIVRSGGAQAIEGPQVWNEYSADYYAVFFEDHDGNRFEIIYRD